MTRIHDQDTPTGCLAFPPHSEPRLDGGRCRTCYPSDTDTRFVTLPAPSPPRRVAAPVSEPDTPEPAERRSAARALDALCYVITGIACFVAAAHTHHGVGTPVLIGLGCVGYGAYIALTRGSYWVTSVTYAVPIIAVLWLFS